MYGLEIIRRINGANPPARPPYALRFHPRIVALRQQVNALPIDPEYRRWLRHSLWKYAEEIIAREEPPRDQGWDDLEDLQQVTLMDRMGAVLKERC